MGNSFYWRLAKNNLIRNRRMYFPYVVATTIMSAMVFIIINTIKSESVANVNYGGTLGFMMMVGRVIMVFFTVGFMFYINSFLIKRRKKEFGLYGILGLEKRHVSRIVRIESALLNGVSLLLGLLCGTVFGRLVFMALMKVTNMADGEFTLAPSAYATTAAIFLVIFIVSTIYNQLQVRLANPIDLINGEKKGEKKPRGLVPIAIIGVLCLGAAYATSIFTKIGSVALTLFWPAVILVIIGTSCLFRAGCQVFLGLLKKNKNHYYKPQNFISISSLIYRLKQNASALYNICILCTMVLVTVSGVCSLYFGQESILVKQNPDDTMVEIAYDRRLDMPDMTDAEKAVRVYAEECGVEIEEFYSYYAMRDTIALVDGEFLFTDESGEIANLAFNDYDKMYPLYIITEADFNRISGKGVSLEPNEVAVLTDKPVNSAALHINGSQYKIKSVLADTPFTHCKNSELNNGIFFVAHDLESATALRYAVNANLANDQYYGEFIGYRNVVLNYSGDAESSLRFGTDADWIIYDSLLPQLPDSSYTSTDINVNRVESNVTYGGLLFLGIFFAILFLVNTVIIMYFKQVSEGYEDRERFVILQKVGMSDKEVRRTINKQVITMFFLPLAVALVHLLASSNMLVQILSCLILTEFSTVMLSILITAAVFSIVYVLVFNSTAKVYYKLVKW